MGSAKQRPGDRLARPARRNMKPRLSKEVPSKIPKMFSKPPQAARQNKMVKPERRK
jgi:hypothetical protein